MEKRERRAAGRTRPETQRQQGSLFGKRRGVTKQATNATPGNTEACLSDNRRNLVGPRLSDDLLVSLLAKALVEASDKIQKTSALPFPFPPSLSLLFHHFAVENLWKQRGFPTTFQELWLWAHNPFGKLGLEPPPYVAPDEKLLVDGLPTSLCLDLVMVEPDPEAEICARLMQDMQNYCLGEKERGQAAYVAFRRLLIECPVLTLEERDRHYMKQPVLHLLARYVEKAYDEAPRSAAPQGYFEICPHCQNLCLPTRDGRICSEPACHRRNAGKTLPRHRLPATGRVLWLRPGLRRYVAAPGQTEVRLAETFRKMGIVTELWPGVDAYDLRLCFPDGEVWAMDVKDWRNPRMLAKKLKQKGGPPSLPGWDQWFWVFPDHRKAENDRWLQDFHAEYSPPPKIRACFEKEMIALVRKKLMGRKNPAAAALTVCSLNQ